MKSQEDKVKSQSEYYINLPSSQTTELLFYPTEVGRFFYEAGYQLSRNTYDNFLLMYIQSGNMKLAYENQDPFTASADSMVLLDCYRPHSYTCQTDCEVLWIHLNGVQMRAFYDLIITNLGSVFNPQAHYNVQVTKMEQIYYLVASSSRRDAYMSKLIYDILTSLIGGPTESSRKNSDNMMAEHIISYVHNHISEEIDNETLAKYVSMSPYHFIRVFKKETGLTPHEYILKLRIRTAMFMLSGSNASVKSIGYACGFSCESVFCSAFKKASGVTPSEFRKRRMLS